MSDTLLDRLLAIEPKTTAQKAYHRRLTGLKAKYDLQGIDPDLDILEHIAIQMGVKREEVHDKVAIERYYRAREAKDVKRGKVSSK